MHTLKSQLIRVTWLINMCDMTHSYLGHDSFMGNGKVLRSWSGGLSQNWAHCQIYHTQWTLLILKLLLTIDTLNSHPRPNLLHTMDTPTTFTTYHGHSQIASDWFVHQIGSTLVKTAWTCRRGALVVKSSASNSWLILVFKCCNICSVAHILNFNRKVKHTTRYHPPS